MLVAEPLAVDSALPTGKSYYANERLAFTLACSTLVSFLAQYHFDRMHAGIADPSEYQRIRAARDKLLQEGIVLPKTAPMKIHIP